MSILGAILELYANALSNFMSMLLGVNLKDIRKILNKEREGDGNQISDSIDIVSKKLEDSKDIIENALHEIDNQKKLFEQMKKEAEVSQQIASMNEDQVAALNKLLEKTLDTQDKKAFPKTLLWNVFFCILSAVLGFLLGKFL